MKITIKGTEYEIRQSEQKLPPEIKAQWVEALRSGKFPQGKYVLCANGDYCCLGVLSSLQGRLTPSGNDGLGGSETVLDCSNPLNWVNDVRVVVADGTFTLIGLNDNGIPFSQIADIIDYAL